MPDNQPSDVWSIQRGEDRFSAPDLATARQWYLDGRIRADDLLFHPSLGDWKRPADVPQLRQGAQAASATKSASGSRRWLLVPVAGCGGVLLIALLASMAGSVGTTVNKALSGPPKLIVTEEALDDRLEEGQPAWTLAVQVVNVSDQPLSDMTLNVEWKQPNGKPASKGLGTLRDPLQPGQMTWVSASGKIDGRVNPLTPPKYEDFLPKSNADRMFMKSWEIEEAQHAFMKAREQHEEVTSNIAQKLREGIVYQFFDASGRALAYRNSAAGDEITPQQQHLVASAFAVFERAKNAEQARHRQEELEREESERRKEHQLAVAAAAAAREGEIAVAVQQLRDFLDREVKAHTAVYRASSDARTPARILSAEEAIIRELDRQIEVRRRQGFGTEEILQHFEPLLEEARVKWRAAVAALAEKSGRT